MRMQRRRGVLGDDRASGRPSRGTVVMEVPWWSGASRFSPGYKSTARSNQSVEYLTYDSTRKQT